MIAAACADAGLDLPLPDAPLDGPGVEVVTRHGHGVTYTFAINHTDQPARLALAGTDLVSGEERSGEWELPAGKVAVIRG